MALAPPPYEVSAPDGNRYFKILGPQGSLLRGYTLLLEARAIAMSMKNQEGRARALAIDTIIRDTQRKVDQAAVQAAQVAEQAVVGLINARQLRPDPPGKSSGRRLKDSIKARAIRTMPSGGAVGIGDLGVLSRVADDQGREYWRAQEFGSRHRVGKAVTGAFMPGGAIASQFEFRVHPVFEAGAPTALTGKPDRMFIRNPIPEKAFLREGAYKAAEYRSRAFETISRAAVAEMRLVQTGNHPRLKEARRFVRGRRLP